MKNPPGVGRDASDGIWYYVWLKPEWKLYVLYGELIQHADQWRESVVPDIAKHYKIDSRPLAPLYYSMPRGRVVSERYGEKYRIVHGGDFPSSLGESAEIKSLVGLFGLSNRMILGKVSVEFHEHETMDADHQKRMKKIIGKIPY